MPKLILEELLKKRKISKRKLARDCKMAYAGTFKWYRKGYNPTFKTMCMWAKHIPCRIRDLVQED
jgi:hypothetical protein